MNYTAINDGVIGVMQNTPLNAFLCSCNNNWAMFGFLLFIVLFFWFVGYMSGCNVRKKEP